MRAFTVVATGLRGASHPKNGVPSLLLALVVAAPAFAADPASTTAPASAVGPAAAAGAGYSPAGGLDEGVLVHESHDGRFKWWLDGRVMVDTAFYSEGDNPLGNGTELRRVRLAMKSILWGDWAGEVDVGYADDEVEVKDAWVGYVGFDSAIVRIGNHKEPFSLEELTSSRHITFMERALPNVFAPGRSIGASYSRWGKRWYFSGGVFGEEADEVDEEGEDDGYGVTGRLTFTPVRGERRLLHLGGSWSYRTPDAGSEDRVRFRVRPETHVNRARFLNTGRITEVDSYSRLGIEAAAVLGPVSVQGEYLATKVSRLDDTPAADLDGWYGFVSWFPTGESRPYDRSQGEFARVVPRRSSGAFEVAVRYSELDLNDLPAGVEGGRSEIITLGLNWYANANVRFMVNVNRVENDAFADADGDLVGGDEFTALQARFQVTF